MKDKEKQALIDWCEWRIARGSKVTMSEQALKAAKITLAALTAQPDDWQQRAEAAEAKLAKAERAMGAKLAETEALSESRFDRVVELQAKVDYLFDKLAELERQEPVAYTDEEELKVMRQGTYADMFTPHDSYKLDPQWIPLFTRPAPAINLAELVPDDVRRDAMRYRFLRERDYFGADNEAGLASWDDLCDLDCNEFDVAVDARMNHPESMYSSILRNIEEAQKK